MTSKAMPETTGALATVQGPSVAVTVIAAWLIPGAGHLLHGRMLKAVWFFVLLSLMYAIGLGFAGRLFPFQLAEPLVFLAAISEWSLGAPRLVALAAGGGAGEVTTVTYEYGNTFLIVAGLLNMLVMLDAADLASGRKPR
jgi:hypothetical protein